MNGKNYKDNARKKGSQSDICPAPTAILPKRCQLILEKASKAKNLCDTGVRWTNQISLHKTHSQFSLISVPD